VIDLGRAGRIALASSYGLPGREVERAYERGVGFFFWGALRRRDFGGALRRIARRGRVAIAIQTYARRASLVRPSVDLARLRLGVDAIDVLGLGFWKEPPPRAILEAAIALREKGIVGSVVVSSHERSTLATLIETGSLDGIMARYNAAHPGAEREVFPLALAHRRPVLAYTATRWGTLVGPMAATDCYRFVLAHPAVTTCLAAPKDARELDDVLAVLDAPPLSAPELAAMRAIGARARAARPPPLGLVDHARAIVRELRARGITEELVSHFLR
jgi:aryl-alcohol dehydrogenase-like predicted oxidoreductase